MTNYILICALALAVPTVLLATMVVFVGDIHFVPGDPVATQVGLDPDPAVVAQLRADYGLDQPLPVQYGKWLGHVVRGDWGKSIFTRQPVLDEIILERVPVKPLNPGVISLTLAFLLAILIGWFLLCIWGRPA